MVETNGREFDTAAMMAHVLTHRQQHEEEQQTYRIWRRNATWQVSALDNAIQERERFNNSVTA